MPHFISSNSRLCRDYAQMTFNYMRDFYEAHPEVSHSFSPPEPIVCAPFRIVAHTIYWSWEQDMDALRTFSLVIWPDCR